MSEYVRYTHEQITDAIIMSLLNEHMTGSTEQVAQDFINSCVNVEGGPRNPFLKTSTISETTITSVASQMFDESRKKRILGKLHIPEYFV